MPPSSRPVLPQKRTGQIGESLAAALLVSKGYTIIAQNWHCPRGEIDIIALHQGCYIFVEVRTRRAESTEAAFVSIQPKKRERLVASSQWYCSHNLDDDAAWRIDVIAVALPYRGSPLIEHLENALDW